MASTLGNLRGMYRFLRHWVIKLGVEAWKNKSTERKVEELEGKRAPKWNLSMHFTEEVKIYAIADQNKAGRKIRRMGMGTGIGIGRETLCMTMTLANEWER